MKHSAINAIMRKSAIILLMFYGTLSVSAQYYMNVFRKDGTKIQYLISDLDSMSIAEKPAPINYEYVDLGLSVNWATFNVGATKPEEYGDYYAWGETETKPVYDWSTYKFFEKIDVDDKGQLILNPYNSTNLHSKDDVASVKWGGNWRMPLKEEFDELIEKCTWIFVKQNGVYGYKVSSNLVGYEGNSIFIPASGCRDGEYSYGSDLLGVDTACLYWSSTICHFNYEHYDDYAYCLYFDNEYDFDDGMGHYLFLPRFNGLSVRPVCPSDEWLKNLSLTLNKSKESVIPFSVFTLNATAKNGSQDAGRFVKWSSDNPAVANVDEKGVVTCLSVGTAVIKAYIRDVAATCTITVREPSLVAEAVDLGLSVKWATCNVGAEKPEDLGGYYAWGETETKSSYFFTNYRFYESGTNCIDDGSKYSKYNSDDRFGTVDNKKVLDKEDDVASVKWGGSWRIPTKEEFTELIENCTWVWTNRNGVNGYKVTSNKTGYTESSIFMPATGLFYGDDFFYDGSDGSYWCNSLVDKNPSVIDENNPSLANSLIFPYWNNEDEEFYDAAVGYSSREIGLSVRPVCP